MRTGRLVLALVMAAVLAGCSGPPSGLPTGSTTPSVVSVAPEPAIQPGTSGTVEVGDRPFTLYVPAGYNPATPTSLLVALHGFTSNSVEAYGFFGLDAADARGVLVALPDGTANPRGEQFWNASTACCDFYASGVDDVGYLTDVVAAVQQGYAVDPGRVFFAGHSNGGFMALRMACERADLVAAAVSVAGAMDVGGECDPSRPVSVLQVHGDADDTVRFDGGDINHDEYTSADATTTRWREQDSCPAAQTTATTPTIDADERVPGKDLVQQSWSGCADGSKVALWRIEGGSHVPSITPALTQALLDWLEASARQ